jgi:aerobic carbon-monoxide dehydrogenase medium subunit
MKPCAFRYFAVGSIDGALALKAEYGDDARFLAGGQSLIPAMNFRMAQPAVLIDINPIASLDYVHYEDRVVRIGALTRYRTLQRSDVVARQQPLLHEALPQVAHPQIRNRGTLGGNLSHADPASELPAVILALGGRVRTRSIRGERWIAAKEFFTGPLTTGLATDEMLVEVEIPDLPPRTGTCFLEIARRRGDYAMMGVSAVVSLGESGTCVDARLAYCNAGDTPLLACNASRTLLGRRLSDSDIAEAVTVAHAEVQPRGSVHASPEYQRHLAVVLTRRALRIARLRATPGHE